MKDEWRMNEGTFNRIKYYWTCYSKTQIEWRMNEGWMKDEWTIVWILPIIQLNEGIKVYSIVWILPTFIHKTQIEREGMNGSMDFIL